MQMRKWLILFILLFMPFPAQGEVPPDTGGEKGLVPLEQVAVPPDEQEEFPEIKPVADPLEPWNRLMFFLNDRLYFALVRPIAQGYAFVVPEWGRIRVRNIFENLGTPVRFISSLLQGKMNGAGNELLRFLLNTSIGVGGMFDVADNNFKIKGSDEDLGQTLGHYGIGEGFFIVWPLLGASNARDSFGLAGGYFLDPVSYITPLEASLAVRSYGYENDASLRVGEYEDLKEAAVDPYVSLKDAYTEYRRHKVKE